MRNPYMKFQDTSFNSLKVTVGSKKCDAHTDARTHAYMSKSNMPTIFFQRWGHKENKVTVERYLVVVEVLSRVNCALPRCCLRFQVLR